MKNLIIIITGLLLSCSTVQKSNYTEIPDSCQYSKPDTVEGMFQMSTCLEKNVHKRDENTKFDDIVCFCRERVHKIGIGVLGE